MDDRKPVDATLTTDAEFGDAAREAFREKCERLVATLDEELAGIGFAVFVGTTEGGAGAVMSNMPSNEVALMVNHWLRLYTKWIEEAVKTEKGKMS